ncbi:MAG: histidine kinase [Cyclobacteriaceae bacterium]|nr:histidine kinase [Cyclobacteriaceae bacterium]
MHNPITKNRKYLAVYFAIWILLAVIQASLFYFLLDIGLVPSIADSLVFNTLLSVVGLAVWPLVVFSSLERAYLTNTVLTHLVGALVLVAIWVGASVGLLHSVLEGQSAYLAFLNASLPWRVASGAIIYLLFVLNYYLFVYSEDFRERKINEAELKRTLKEAELSMLKSQLNPHFIFNSLNSISSLTMSNPEKAQEMVIALSDFLRYAVKPGQNKLITLRDELDAINQFVLIEKVRFGDRLEVIVNCPKDCEKKSVPPLIIQPLVENAVKYGIHETIEEGLISIDCICNHSVLEVVIKNNFEPDSGRTEKAGVGLGNVRSRLKLLFENDNLLSINKEENMFEVKLRIPQTQ